MPPQLDLMHPLQFVPIRAPEYPAVFGDAQPGRVVGKVEYQRVAGLYAGGRGDSLIAIEKRTFDIIPLPESSIGNSTVRSSYLISPSHSPANGRPCAMANNAIEAIIATPLRVSTEQVRINVSSSPAHVTGLN